MEKLPPSITILFVITTAFSFLLFIKAVKNKLIVAVSCLGWLTATGILAQNRFFQNTSIMPPRLAFAILPPIMITLLLFLTRRGRRFIDKLDVKALTLVHIVRVPVELILYALAAQKLIPELMTFEGRNFDVLSGITAPIIYFICFKNSNIIHRKILLTWNFICLGLLLNIVINAILSAPFPFQRFAFDQPNIAILYFPYAWLPAFIVVIVLFSHLAAIRALVNRRN